MFIHNIIKQKISIDDIPEKGTNKQKNIFYTTGPVFITDCYNDYPNKEEIRGAIYQIFFLNLSNTCTSKFCATKNATPEPIAILIEIISSKFVDTKSVSSIPIIKPIKTTFLATNLPYARLAKSVIKNVIG